jgi:hypothetical protein
MKLKGIWTCCALLLPMLLILGVGNALLATAAPTGRMLLAADDPPTLKVTMPAWAQGSGADGFTPDGSPPGSVLSSQQQLSLSSASFNAASDVIEVFANTWSYSTIGLVYIPGQDLVRYAHESQSSTHNPTLYDVDYISHTVMYSTALSTQNSSWPWQIDNRDGAGYDFVHNTTFLPDYNGDLSYADDNIVEIDRDGKILNAWEMDDEVGSNDSSDGTEIDSIIDIAVVPGNPPRYFVTAAYDDGIVYEISLTKTGTWWTPNSWRTVMTYTGAIAEVFQDNLGIDYDAEHEVLFHSGWHTTTILITDLDMNPISEVSATFDCPGAGGYNSGVTYIEGSAPTEVWVTDFSSDKTTRCATPFGGAPVEAGWEKWVDGSPWAPDLALSTQTRQVFQVTDIVTAVEPFTLTETWDPDRLKLVQAEVLPPVGTAITTAGSLDVQVPAGPPEVVTITKWFSVEPCDWITTILTEELVVEGNPPFSVRPITITKESPVLAIESTYSPEVYSGGILSFTLSYSNTGGYENNVWISAAFPITAQLLYAEPFPDLVGSGGQSARWNVGDLAQDDRGSIDVYALVSETVPTSSTITIWNGIFGHTDVLQDETEIAFHANQETFSLGWEKRVNGEPWQPGISIALQTSETLQIEETIELPALNAFSLIEEWDPNQLALLSTVEIEADPGIAFTPTLVGPDLWSLEALSLVPVIPQTITITKEFRVEPCTWSETVLWESLLGGVEGIRVRPVIVRKEQPSMWIDSAYDEAVYGGDVTEFVLTYGNVGGLESRAWISSSFPAEALFIDSDPPPADAAPDGRWVWWDLGPLSTDVGEQITVAVEIASGLVPSTTIEIRNTLYNHVDEPVDEAWMAYHVPPPVWDKWVNDSPWDFDQAVRVHPSDLFTVTDVISTRSAAAIVEHWNPEHLTLRSYIREPNEGIILSDPGFLSWEFPGGVPGVITITKIYSVEPYTSTYAVLWEELWVEDVQWERRPVQIDMLPTVYLPIVLRNSQP